MQKVQLIVPLEYLVSRLCQSMAAQGGTSLLSFWLFEDPDRPKSRLSKAGSLACISFRCPLFLTSRDMHLLPPFSLTCIKTFILFHSTSL
jgi:hypothetical protein